MLSSERIIAAIDVPSLGEASELCRKLKGSIGIVKIGLELFASEGPPAVRVALYAGVPVFLDLKLHDIPNTVAGAAAAAARLGVRFLTVHAAGGPAMIAAARKAVEGSPTKILAVTVLTSMTQKEMELQAIPGSVEDHVVRLARTSFDAGAHGFVASTLEARALRAALGPSALLVVPGIRMPGDAIGDQARVATPREAVEAGADYIVVGRPIRDAADPAAAARLIAENLG